MPPENVELEMAMPASVDSSAARGVALRTRSANGAAASSMTPDESVANRPACHATRAGSAAPAAIASVFAGSMMRKTCAKSDTVLIPYGSAHTSVRPVRSASRFACSAYATLPTSTDIAAPGRIRPYTRSAGKPSTPRQSASISRS